MTTPVLSCPHCSLVEVPRLTEGTGPYTAKASCSGCGKFLRWLPKQLLQPKETRMAASINRVTLLGTISKYGMEVRYNPTGTPCTSFTLIVSEAGQDGKTHDVYVPCECWGKKAEAASELETGRLVVFEGKLRKRQKGEQWELIVSGFEVQPVITSSVVTEATV